MSTRGSIRTYFLNTTTTPRTHATILSRSAAIRHRQPIQTRQKSTSTMASSKPNHEQMTDSEKTIKRNPHGNFKEVEASRPSWNKESAWHFTQTVQPAWKPGQGGNDNGASLSKKHVEIDPYEADRPAAFNYKLLISAIIPRPIGFLSTYSADGSSTNLAPFSYFQLINHDPPLFIIGFAGGFERAKDSLRNLSETKECTINIISEHYIEAANACSVNAPFGISEWALTGLTPEKCAKVKASRVKEAVFSVEGQLVETREFESRVQPGKKTGVLAIVEGVRFWVREDAINEERNLIDPNILRPMSRLGGITYGRTTEGLELPRPDWGEFESEAAAAAAVKPKADGQ